MTLPAAIAGHFMPRPPTAPTDGLVEYQAFMQGVQKGLKDRKDGKVTPLSEVMAEFGFR